MNVSRICELPCEIVGLQAVLRRLTGVRLEDDVDIRRSADDTSATAP
jgi:hypothetical protein